MTGCIRCGAPHDCGTVVHTGQAKIAVQLSVPELEELALATSNPATAGKLICAIGLLDPQLAHVVVLDRADAYKENP
jgi:hypothetical protein